MRGTHINSIATLSTSDRKKVIHYSWETPSDNDIHLVGKSRQARIAKLSISIEAEFQIVGPTVTVRHTPAESSDCRPTRKIIDECMQREFMHRVNAALRDRVDETATNEM